MIRRGQWLSFGRQFLERSSFRCIISPSLFSCFPPYSSLWFDQNLFKLAERERESETKRERERKKERGKKRKKRCSDGNTRVEPNPSGCIPYAAGLPVIHGGLVTLEFRWRISAGLSFARSNRVSCCRASKALRNAASDEIPCPSGAPWNSPSSTRRPLPSRRCWYSGLVRPNYSVLMRIAAVTRSGSDRGKMKRRLRVDCIFDLPFGIPSLARNCLSVAFNALPSACLWIFLGCMCLTILFYCV